jgi:hypothetical protein
VAGGPDRHPVQLRTKWLGIRWFEHGARAIFALRALLRSGRFPRRLPPSIAAASRAN